MSIH
jgi:hypothetical protein